MTLYAHVMTLVSFIVSLGMAILLTFGARLIQGRARVVLSAPWLLWLAIVFIDQINFWLFAYAARDMSSLPATTLFLVLGMAILAFLQCALLAPQGEAADRAAGNELDLAEFHARHRAEYIAAVALFDLFTIAYNVHEAWRGSLPDQGWSTHITLGLAVAAAAAAIAWKARWVQLAAPALVLAIRLVSLAYAVIEINR